MPINKPALDFLHEVITVWKYSPAMRESHQGGSKEVCEESSC